ncbi:MAG: carboxypeptidase-like regulatory domain-containing protein [Bacteroidota bacterium]
MVIVPVIRKLALFILLVLGCLDLCAQSRTISGYVRDQSNGESIIGASIFDNRQDKGTASNTFGYYSLTTPYDSAILTVSFVGYDVRRLKIAITHDTTMVIFLHGKVWTKLLSAVIKSREFMKPAEPVPSISRSHK